MLILLSLINNYLRSQIIKAVEGVDQLGGRGRHRDQAHYENHLE